MIQVNIVAAMVLQDLLVWRDARVERAEILYWRTALGEEVDFVIEADGRLLPVEIKATSRPRLEDATHLRTILRGIRQEGAGWAPAPHGRSHGVAGSSRARRPLVARAVSVNNLHREATWR